MKSYTALVIDDERLARVTLIKELNHFSEIDIIGEASSIETAVHAISELKPEVLFLDIQLSDGNGFDLLDRVDFNGKIIFVTAFDEYAVRAFEINAFDYLMKPVSPERLKTVIERITGPEVPLVTKISRFRYSDRIMIELRKSIHFLKIDSLVCIKADRDYTTLTDSNGKEYLLYENIGNWENKLPEDHFARVHRNTIINFNFVEKAEKVDQTAWIYMKNITRPVMVSRGYYKKIKSRYFYK